MKKISSFALLTVLLAACKGNYAEVDQMDWIAGNWKGSVQGNEVFESWTRTNDSTWTGTSRFEKDGELLFSEKMTITKRKDIFSFTSVSNEQNDGNAVQFIASEIDPEQVIFENLAHDFPQQIVYKKTAADSLLVYIDGNLNGQANRIDFPLKKVK